ncbi:hypothetical protein [Dickeya dadantii]|uniref:hypothetical protein n=1 Tax=Dickeya dadantii TaxID=204038 RepID=UPI00149566BA|nr:hypothetical protein [Dickeya dadantii]NPE51477.1 hypothetical protein [Dickeya dadantii]
MKITPVNTSLFGKDSELIKSYFEYFTELLAERFEVQPEAFATYLGTFELFLMTRRWDGDLSSLEAKVNILMEWFASLDKSVAKAVFVKANESCREANDSFWSMINSDPRTNNDYTFKENIDKRFEIINSVLEFMVAREGWLIAAFQREKVDVREAIPLNNLLDSCKSFLGEDSNLAVVNENLFDIPLNQWRNIAAHKSYKCLGGKVDASYGRNIVKVATLSEDELDRACMEIYKLRIGVKLVVGLTLTIVAARNQDFIDVAQSSPRSFLHDLNYLLKKYGAQVESFVLLNELVVGGDKIEVPDDFSIFDVKFTYDGADTSDDARLLDIVVRIAKVLSHLFSEYNSLPEKEKVLLHFSRSPDNGFHMLYSYDEYDGLA